MGIIGIIERKRLQINQRQTARLNKKRLKVKAKYERQKVKSKNKASISQYEKKISKLKGKGKKRSFGTTNRMGTNSAPYWLKSGSSGGEMFGQSSTPYWLKGEEKKENKRKRKSITIRL